MKITVIPTGNAPEFYTFNGDIITAVKDGQSEAFDLSGLQNGDKLMGVDADTLDLPGGQIIRAAERDSNGELHVTLCQRVGAGHWEAGATFDASVYNPEAVNVTYRSDKPHAGKAYAVTKVGKVWAQ